MNHMEMMLQVYVRRDYLEIFNIAAVDAQWLINPVLARQTLDCG